MAELKRTEAKIDHEGPIGSTTAPGFMRHAHSPPVKIKGEAVRPHRAFLPGCSGKRTDLHQRQPAVRDIDGDPELKIQLPGPSAPEHSYLHDQTTRVNGLYDTRAAAIFDDTICPHPGSVDGSHLAQTYRPIDGAG